MRNWQEARHLGVEQPDEFWVHVFVFVGYVEADDSLVREVLPELGSDFVSVRLLHDEDDFCPLNQLWRQWIIGIVVRSRRGAFDTWIACEYLLSCWATQAILATNEEDAPHVSRLDTRLGAHTMLGHTILLLTQTQRHNADGRSSPDALCLAFDAYTV
jgi:hypothetical protein